MKYGQKDGFGYSFLKGDGKERNFVTYKYALSFTELLKRGYPLLNHLPNDGWTIVHMRNASVGSICKENCHPFVINNRWSICHNGGFRPHRIVSSALSKFINLQGQTDSEVAANLINIISPKVFALSDEIEDTGVFLCLNKNGTLEVIKNSGELCFYEDKETKKIILSSQLSYKDYFDQQIAWRGWYKFDADGMFTDFKKREYSTYHGYNVPAWVSHGVKVRRAARSCEILPNKGGNVNSAFSVCMGYGDGM